MANPSGALWNWSVEGLVAPVEIHAGLAAVLARPVVRLGAADGTHLPEGGLMCDVWHTDGDFPTWVDCYFPPAEVAETYAVAAFARRIRRRCLLPDDTLDGGRFLLAAPDGTLRPVHLEVHDAADGPTLTNLRPCTIPHPRSRERTQCRQSRWAPGTVVPGRAAA